MNTLLAHDGDGPQIIHGDCIEVMLGMGDNSIDAIVTDPPYGLGFMGKEWDQLPPGQDWAEECLRVLKPGGHLLAFGGTRTWHRLATAIEDAGFEMRDSIAWLHSEGFPKSSDVSKAMDKAGGDPLRFTRFATAYARAVAESPLTHSDVDRALGIKASSCYWARTDHRGSLPPRHHWEAVRELFDMPGDIVTLYDEAERIVIGERRQRGTSIGSTVAFNTCSGDVELITEAATPLARKWQGWGTALKPAFEPIVMARKPFKGTIAQNIAAMGVGAINIAATRHQERWPANVILDDTQAGALEESRYFYTAKARKAERPVVDGVAHPTVKPLALMRWLVRLVTPVGGTVLEPFAGSGATVEACILEGFHCIAIEREAEYLPLIQQRIERAA